MKRSARGVRIVKDRLEQAISNERILVCVVAWESRHSSNQPSSTGLRHVGLITMMHEIFDACVANCSHSAGYGSVCRRDTEGVGMKVHTPLCCTFLFS